MHKEIKKQWLTALRNGEYKQGTGALNYQDGDKPREYCCLGVLCELAVKQGVSVTVSTDGLGITSYDDTTSHLPTSVREWAGLVESNPWINSIGESLASMNDNGRSFDYIARRIEESL